MHAWQKRWIGLTLQNSDDRITLLSSHIFPPCVQIYINLIPRLLLFIYLVFKNILSSELSFFHEQMRVSKGGISLCCVCNLTPSINVLYFVSFENCDNDDKKKAL